MDLYTLMTCAALFVYDGDTVRCDGQLLRMLGDGAPNVAGVDTPELGAHADCDLEHQLGVLAAARLAELLALPGLTIEDSGVRDRYGRPLVKLRLANGRTAGQILIDEGHASEWRPGARIDWCRPAP